MPGGGFSLYPVYYGCATWEGEFEKILPYSQIFGADAPYLRVGSLISKWHTRIQKSGKSPPRAKMLSAMLKVVHDVSELPGCHPQLFWRHRLQETAQKVGQTSVTSHKLWVATWQLRNVTQHGKHRTKLWNTENSAKLSKGMCKWS